MLDSYTSTMCMESWGRSSFAWAMIELICGVEALPHGGGTKFWGEGYRVHTIHIEYEWTPLSCSSCTKDTTEERINDLEKQMLDGKLVLVDYDGKPLKKVNNPINADSDSEVEESMHEQWRETYTEDPYDDDDFDDCGLTDDLMAFANKFNISLCGQL
ncbi:hypothetical protein Tco_0413935 [Tanacetum coccineum]